MGQKLSFHFFLQCFFIQGVLGLLFLAFTVSTSAAEKASSVAIVDGTLQIKVIQANYKTVRSSWLPISSAPSFDFEIQYVQPTNYAELEAAQKWLKLNEEAIPQNQRYIITFGDQDYKTQNGQGREIAPDALEREEIHISKSRLQKLGSFLKEKMSFKVKEETKEKVEEFIYRFSTDQVRLGPLPLNYRPTFAIFRGITVGAVNAASFVYSAIPGGTNATASLFIKTFVARPELALVGAGVGVMSGTIQYFIKPFSDLLNKKGAIYESYRDIFKKFTYQKSLNYAHRAGYDNAAAKKIAQDFTDSYVETEIPKIVLEDSNLLTKWFITEVIFVTLIKAGLFAAGAVDDASLLEAAISVLTVSALATTGQGFWDFSFIKDQAKREEALKQKKANLEAADESAESEGHKIEAALAQNEFSLSMKSFTISVASNLAVALTLVGDKMTAEVGENILTGMSVLGATYYGYILFKHSPSVRLIVDTKIQTIKEKKTKIVKSCAELLNKAFPPPPLLPGINI